ncbi:alpha/beta fold hydrolase [Pseudactinotalea sp. Z1739]|uniref:alpha/beta fold hydrolase n=1 Tax=Pseudactinotalea sp. Z1739 TaxID=3413028 RepID=UPI003C7B85FE
MSMDIVLIAGLWLDARAWDEVAGELRRLGHRPHPVALPGQTSGSAGQQATLADQVEAVLQAVDAASGQVLVVGHSAACTLAWIAADARPEKVATVALIGGFPAADGGTYADFFEPTNGQVPFPGWEAFEGPDSADLDQAAKDRFSAAAIPVPGTVTKGVVHLRDERRYAVPVVLVCPEYSAEDAEAWLKAGEMPELTKAEQVAFVDIDSGHWPMLTRPGELAQILSTLAG